MRAHDSAIPAAPVAVLFPNRAHCCWLGLACSSLALAGENTRSNLVVAFQAKSSVEAGAATVLQCQPRCCIGRSCTCAGCVPIVRIVKALSRSSSCSSSSPSSASWWRCSCPPFRPREAARRAQCQNNLKNTALAVLNYESAKKILPIGTRFYEPITKQPPKPNGYVEWQIQDNFDFRESWMTEILPYIEQQPLRDSINYTVAMQNALNLDERGVVIPGVLCPSDGNNQVKYQGHGGNWARSATMPRTSASAPRIPFPSSPTSRRRSPDQRAKAGIITVHAASWVRTSLRNSVRSSTAPARPA